MGDSSSNRWASLLAINRTVAVVLATVLLFGLGEELWRSFLPVYLKAQSKEMAEHASGQGLVDAAALWWVGGFALVLNLFEGCCYIGGGQVTAWLGDRGSLIVFGVATLSGYVLFLALPWPWATVLATLLILGWEPLSVPVTFTTVGSTVVGDKQGMAFALQSIQKRLPKIIGPALAGFVLEAAEKTASTREAGQVAGMHVLVALALGLGALSLALQLRYMPKRKTATTPSFTLDIVRQFPPRLKRLLLAEVFTRWCDWLVREFVVLYVVFVRGVSLSTAGLLITLQHVTALVTYLPIGRLTQTVGGQPFIGLTFIFFAAFPLTLWLMPSNQWLWVAFIVYGLREIGEPARKALITTSIPEAVRARGVGLYWGLRSFAICWAGLVGAWLWLMEGPEVLLLIACGIGAVGAAVFYGLVYRAAS